MDVPPSPRTACVEPGMRCNSNDPPVVDEGFGGVSDVDATIGAVARFLTLADIAEVLNISAAQAYALVRSGELRAIKVGGRGQWRVEESELESYIERMYAATEDFVRAHPFGREDPFADEPGAADD